MFERARIELTGWYLLIIMTISILFSIGIYISIHREYQRFERGIGEGRRFLLRANPEVTPPSDMMYFSDNALAESQMRVMWFLLFTNGAIFIVAGSAGYFLAGRTLRPIQHMLEKQTLFIQDASHELRTPLTVLRTEIEVALQNKSLSKETKHLFQSNLEEVIRLQKLSDNLLSLVTNKSSVASTKSIQLKDTLSHAIAQIKPLADQKEITIKQSLAKCSIQAIEEKVREVFVIFLDNAVKYSANRTTITVSLKTLQKKAIVTITDQGVGIESKDLTQIFERFYRVGTSRSKDFVDGFGLGLPIAKKIVEEHYGTIDVKSTPAKGSTFTIVFPLS